MNRVRNFCDRQGWVAVQTVDTSQQRLISSWLFAALLAAGFSVHGDLHWKPFRRNYALSGTLGSGRRDPGSVPTSDAPNVVFVVWRH
jgi:hypothetical protein